MDGEQHAGHRKVDQPVASPRKRAVEILESLPVGETFDLVDRVSIELTTGMLATLFDFPYAERRKLTHLSDMATGSPSLVGANLTDEEARRAVLREWLAEFSQL